MNSSKLKRALPQIVYWYPTMYPKHILNLKISNLGESPGEGIYR